MEVLISEDGFINMLRAQNGGALVDELDREMVKGIQAIFDNGGSTNITLKIKVSRIPGMETAVLIAHDVIAKHPQEPRQTKSMFITKGSGLADQPQEQTTMDLGQPVERPRATLVPLSNLTKD